MDRAAVLDLSLRLKVPEGESVIRATAAGNVFEKKVTGEAVQELPLGTVSVKAAGYVRVDLQGLRKNGPMFAEVADLLVGSEVADLKLKLQAAGVSPAVINIQVIQKDEKPQYRGMETDFRTPILRFLGGLDNPSVGLPGGLVVVNPAVVVRALQFACGGFIKADFDHRVHLQDGGRVDRCDRPFHGFRDGAGLVFAKG